VLEPTPQPKQANKSTRKKAATKRLHRESEFGIQSSNPANLPSKKFAPTIVAYRVARRFLGCFDMDQTLI
jgi:hypothetical protein